jgi:hypothetical protein
MDALDGRRTTVTWHPNYLLATREQVAPLQKVIQGHAGLFYYEHCAIAGSAGARTPFLQLMTTQRYSGLLQVSPNAVVFGPNNFRSLR